MPLRKPFKNYRDDDRHPTRAEPETLKKVTPEIRFFKTLARVARFWGGVDRGNVEAVATAERCMPFIRKHILAHRPDVVSKKHLDKELLDAVQAVRRTMVKYQAPYLGGGLSAHKRKELRLALRVLRRSTVLEEGDVEVLLRSIQL